MMKALLIGGPFDGKRVEINNDSPYISLTSPPYFPYGFSDECIDPRSAMREVHRYQLIDIRGRNGEINKVYQHEDDKCCPLYRLILGYKEKQ